MTLIIASLLAGMLTIAAPCILPLLPVIIGGSVSPAGTGVARRIRPLVITTSLALSVVVFTLLLKATTVLLGVPQMVWQVLSACIVIVLGLNLIFPQLWEVFTSRTKLYTGSNKILGKTLGQSGLGGAVLTGLALGPVFNSCSPTYAFIVAAVLPVSFARGLVYLVSYALGLSLALLLVAYAGQAAITKLGWLTNPKGVFVKILGISFIVVGLFVLFGLDKKLQTFVLDKGWYAPISGLEERLR